MCDEDWESEATAPPFSLLRKITPEEAAKLPSFVDLLVYQQWTRADRRLYQRLRCIKIREDIKKGVKVTMESLTDLLNTMNMNAPKEDDILEEAAEVMDLIRQLKRQILEDDVKPKRSLRR